MTEDLQRLAEDKDSTRSCVFDYPDRPIDTLPPNLPPPETAPPDLPYDPTFDWPFIPHTDPPTPGIDPIPGSDPHPNSTAFNDFLFFIPYYWEHQNTNPSLVDTTQYANFQYWETNNFPDTYTGERHLVTLGWWSNTQHAWVKADIISYPSIGGVNSPRTRMESTFVSETGHSYAEASIPPGPNNSDWNIGVKIETGVLLISRFFNFNHGNPPNPATYDIFVFYYAKYTNGAIIFNTSNPLTWPLISIGPSPIISLRAPVVGTTISLESYQLTQAKLNQYGYYQLAMEKTINTPTIHIPSDAVPLDLNIGY